MATQLNVTGTIAADELLTLSAVRRRLGLGEHAMRQARRSGLPIYKIGRRHFVHGADVIKWAKGRRDKDDK